MKSVNSVLKILPVSLSFYFLAIEQTTSLRRTSNPFTQKDGVEKVEGGATELNKGKRKR